MKNPLKDATVEITFIYDPKAKIYPLDPFDTSISLKNIIKGTLVGVSIFVLGITILIIFVAIYSANNPVV
ncbi:hypothetical protein COT44_02630 [Candidatus Shapirobacteria bacterium CG08_land_8_20_14_0_20_39_18]|uniref:Uncharacterized protein n=1 Tax=Candidatus Shapirobacteria bacterium CG08_land_8_20_14_0_20_39_18 TaxID=1974883 RepID=A0A2M6XD83_9BACT|nr:MAG: hypothetical protein COT44_02630 [Candidatus Shapirobacteria bacterium CG08_land_8_20_14_0_20_39_18]PIY65291.1 MAG: hypothetical protein COY91_02650 [Candidatus Shapirobacteria bacterium CG_4_10_14_0_8_um_filter_39_15]PJE68366.1 MAG: hypothetical protein COU94_02175 [Candidatus Shapirobacteria bacterium CG10_big_fil_rev_8_21_14_0_10_38_8]